MKNKKYGPILPYYATGRLAAFIQNLDQVLTNIGPQIDLNVPAGVSLCLRFVKSSLIRRPFITLLSYIVGAN